MRSGSRAPMWQDSQRSTMLASGTLIWMMDGIEIGSFLAQAFDLLRLQVDHVVGEVGAERWVLASLAGFSTSPSSALSLVR